jgi:hypothetical protein
MPAFFAASASDLPTAFAWSVFEPDVGDALPARRRQRASRLVVDQLRADTPVRAEHDQARPLRGARDLAAHAAMAAHTRLALREDAHARFPTFLRTCSPA